MNPPLPRAQRPAGALSLLAVLCLLTAASAAAQTTFTVTVVPKTSAHPAQGGWPEGYAIGGVEGRELTLQRGTTYTFQMQDVDAMHPFYISTSTSGASQGVYNEGVSGNFATGSQSLTFTPGASTPDLLYYQCGSHLFMGWRIRITGGVGTDAAPEAPGIVLEQNYPNPFALPTTIAFSLAEAGPVTVAVYDLLGRRVATLLDGPLPAGPHAVTWDGADGLQRPAPPGLYLYRLTAGEHASARVMVHAP
jgi:hypothetical protein